jgi:hypothetical protein
MKDSYIITIYRSRLLYLLEFGNIYPEYDTMANISGKDDDSLDKRPVLEELNIYYYTFFV